ncbi:MAG: branched-chain amino acid ABC transporter permease [SAR324 cluster bacterium]|nr:branched-chain amino acid ABC transporter permease [SAR324 cluster bacterium]|tara:strand:- start:1985 stop:2902 length:918 start_codon:yes stop_codon:yes gene_type:complete
MWEIIISNLEVLQAMPVLNIQLLLDGIFIGAIFALAAYGLALVWGVMNVKNLAQGDFVIMGGYIAWWMSDSMGVHPILGLPVAIVLMFIFGWVVYRFIISRVVGRDMFTSLLATFGLAIVLQQLINQMFGPEVQTAESGFKTRFFMDDMVTVADIKLISFVLTAVLAFIVVTFMKYSRMGQAIRATAQDVRAAKVMGIDTEKVYAFTYALNAAICGAAGVLISMIWIIQPFFGLAHSIRAFVIVTAAGLGNLPGVIATGLGLGAVEQFGGFIFGAEFQQALVVGMLLLVLIIREIQQSRQRQAVV